MFRSSSNQMFSFGADRACSFSIRIGLLTMAFFLVSTAGSVFADDECPYDENGIPRCGEVVTVPGVMPTPLPPPSSHPDYGALPGLIDGGTTPQPEPTPEQPTNPEEPIDPSCNASQQCVFMDQMVGLRNEASLKKAIERLIVLLTPPEDPGAPRNPCFDLLSGYDPKLENPIVVYQDHVGKDAYHVLKALVLFDNIIFTTGSSSFGGSWWQGDSYVWAEVPTSDDGSAELEIQLNPWAWHEMSPDQQLAILAHELGHVTSADAQTRHCEDIISYLVLGETCNQISEEYSINVARACGIPIEGVDFTKLPKPKDCKVRCPRPAS